MYTEDQQRLEDYKKEISDVYAEISSLTVEELIDAHRRLREVVREYRAREREIFVKALDTGKSQGYKEVTKGEYFHKDVLKAMTVLELANLLSDLQD